VLATSRVAKNARASSARPQASEIAYAIAPEKPSEWASVEAVGPILLLGGDAEKRRVLHESLKADRSPRNEDESTSRNNSEPCRPDASGEGEPQDKRPQKQLEGDRAPGRSGSAPRVIAVSPAGRYDEEQKRVDRTELERLAIEWPEKSDGVAPPISDAEEVEGAHYEEHGEERPQRGRDAEGEYRQRTQQEGEQRGIDVPEAVRKAVVLVRRSARQHLMRRAVEDREVRRYRPAGQRPDRRILIDAAYNVRADNDDHTDAHCDGDEPNPGLPDQSHSLTLDTRPVLSARHRRSAWSRPGRTVRP
jgi:hypothetical protein